MSGTTPEIAAPQPQTYDELVNQIHDLTSRPTITINDVPNPDAARALATGRTHDSLTVLANQVRQLQARQAQRSPVALQLDALHRALISQTHTDVPYVSGLSQFASEGVQGMARLGGRVFDPRNNISTTNRVLDAGVLVAGATAFGLLARKFMRTGSTLPAILRYPWTAIKAVLLSVGTLGTGWLAMRYVDNRAAADETAIDNPDRRRGNATALNTQNAATNEIRTNEPRLNLRNVELTALTVPMRLPNGQLLRFTANGAAVLVRRQTVTPGTNALAESIQTDVDAIHTDSEGEYVVKQGNKTIYVPAADFYTAMQSAVLGTPMILGGFNNPRSITGRQRDSITVNWQRSPA